VPPGIVFQVLLCRFRYKLSWRNISEFFFIRVKGRWCYLYRAMDEDGNLDDVRLSEKRDMQATKALFAQAHEMAQAVSERVVADGHTSYPRAIAEELGAEVEHEVRGYLGNPVEQSHRSIKQRYYPMLGFGAFESAKRFCGAFDAVKQLQLNLLTSTSIDPAGDRPLEVRSQ
jgi:transposase-like protein